MIAANWLFKNGSPMSLNSAVKCEVLDPFRKLGMKFGMSVPRMTKIPITGNLCFPKIVTISVVCSVSTEPPFRHLQLDV